MKSLISQWTSVTLVCLETIPQRLGSSLAAIFGIAGVVIVLVGVLSIGHGFNSVMELTGSPDTAIILRSGSDSEMMSGLTRETSKVIGDSQWVIQSTSGPLISPELFVVINLPKRTTMTDANVPMRGVQTQAFQVHSEVKIVGGRNFTPGTTEIIVGLGAAREFAGLELDGKINVGPNEWTIVGIFSANGSVFESEVWTDSGVLQSAFRREDNFQSVYAKLKSEQAFDDFKDSLTSDPRLSVKVMRQPEFYSEQSQLITNLITGLGTGIAGLMAIGAIFGALNTMYSSVSSRTREIATLRAMGFGAFPVLASILTESMVLALAGGLTGGSLAYLVFDGFQAATMNWQTFSQVTFAFKVTPQLLVQGICYASIIGFVGGLFPAIRATRLPIALALRED